MKLPLTTGYSLNPAQRKLDLSAVPNFDLRRLYAVANLTTGVLIYAVGRPDLGYTDFTSGVLTLDYDTAGMSITDVLFVLYDDGIAPLPGGAATDAKLESIRALLAAPLAISSSIVTADTSGQIAAGASASPVAANLSRQFIKITNTGGSPMSYRFGGVATATLGHILAPGETDTFDGKCPTALLSVFSTNGTSFFITTG